MNARPDVYQGPNALQTVENLKSALKGEEMDAAHIQTNLELLLQESNRVGGDIARLGVSVQDLQYIDSKLTTKASNFGTEFPAELAQSLHELLEKSTETEQTHTEEPSGEIVGHISPELKSQSEQSKIESTVAAFYQWKEIFTDADLSSTGAIWSKIDHGLSRHLDELKGLKGLEAITKGQLPDDVEDHFLDTLRYAQELKTWHDQLQSPTQYRQAA